MSGAAIFNLKPAVRQTLGDSVADSIRDAIFGGLIKPGQRLAESQIASTFKVSRAPVRDAFASLEKEGLVSREANGGTTVAQLSRQDIEEICTLRLPLEALAVQRAVQHGKEDDWARLENNIRTTEKVTSPQELAQMDLDFHETIVKAANHVRLLSNWLNLRSQIQLIMVQRNLADDGSRRGTVQGHKELLKALRARDEAQAVALLELHLKRQHDWVVSSFAEK
ncbi:MAG: GntR family transcriptional regulator [Isosphaeraceae bacterium]|nr:GntR family transcriptional regulator [Isosphaeraceae bacterium]